MIIVAGKILVKPSNRAKFIKASLEAVSAARKTRGCLDFAVSADPIEDNRVNIFEAWSSQKVLNAFRNDGPGDDLSAMIEEIEVQEYSVE